MIYLLEVDIPVHCGNCARVLLFIGRLIITRYMHEELMITCQILSPQGEPRDTSSPATFRTRPLINWGGGVSRIIDPNHMISTNGSQLLPIRTPGHCKQLHMDGSVVDSESEEEPLTLLSELLHKSIFVPSHCPPLVWNSDASLEV